MGNTASGNKGCFIKPKKAWRLLKTADEGNVTAYIFGVSGSGKTTLVSRYLGTRKYMVVDAGGIRPDDLVVESSNARKIIVIDNLHELSWGDVDTVREQIIELIRREDVWVILVGRCPVPPWLSAVRFQEGFYVVDSKLLMFSLEDIKKYAEYAGFSINEAQVQRMYYETTGLPLAVEMCHIKYMEMAYTSEITDDMYNDFSRRVEDEMCNYLEYHVYDNWDVEMQEFLMEISVVDEFTTKQAEMITGRSDSELLIERAKWLGNFMTSRMDKDGNTQYQLQFHMRVSMRRRLKRKYEKERIRGLYENAGLFYRLNGDIRKALEMYENAGVTERIVSILVDNARHAANSGYYYDLKKYYLELPDYVIEKSPELMCGMSMLQSLLLNPDESERWYDRLKLYADENQGSARKNAKGLLLYLDIGLPHRGSVDVLKLLKSAYTMVFNKEVRIQEWSVTSNLPSMMNGGKDFCEWSKRDRELASKVGRIVEFVLGKYGKGLVNLALAESFLEKSGDNYEVATLAAKGRMQAEAGGKIEQCFVADGILAWLHLQNGKPQEALEVLNGIEGKAEKRGRTKSPSQYICI
jgi:LuxR family maltose regulon positive regulatory protein